MNIDKNLYDHVASQKDKKVPYAIVRGTVTPIGTPLQSIMSPSVTGVLQVIKVKYFKFVLHSIVFVYVLHRNDLLSVNIESRGVLRAFGRSNENCFMCHQAKCHFKCRIKVLELKFSIHCQLIFWVRSAIV